MRFLFVLDSVEAPAAVNPQLGRRLAAELARRGHTVHLLELWDGETPPPACGGVTVHTLAFADERLMNRALENGSSHGSPVWLRLARLAAHPTAAAAAFRQLVLKKPRRTVDTRREIERLDAEFHFDAVCAVCAPYRAAFALESARTGGKKLLWQMDPYASNRTYRAPGGYAREAALLDAVDGSFIEASNRADYETGGPLEACRGKVRTLGLPCLVPADGAAPHEGLRCTFVGTLYPELREPGFALELFARLNAPDWTLTVAGPGLQHFDCTAARSVLGERLVTPGPVPIGQGRALQAQADVLLNLGNALDNQIPSKLYEYMGSGKPILHLAARRDDLCCRCLQRYPLALVLCAEDGAAPDAVERLARWLDGVRGKRLPYEQVAALFPDFTPEGVADTFLEGV